MLPGWTTRVPERSAATGPKDLATPSRRSVGAAFGISLRRAVRAVDDDRRSAAERVESFKQILRKIDPPGQSVKNFRRVRCRAVALTGL
jgi:hypothetical protein